MRETRLYFLLDKLLLLLLNKRALFSFVSFILRSHSYVNPRLKLGQILSSVNDRLITLTETGIVLRTRKSDILRNYKCENPVAVS